MGYRISDIDDLKRLHNQFDSELSEISKHKNLTPMETIRVKELKKQKLYAKDLLRLLK